MPTPIPTPHPPTLPFCAGLSNVACGLVGAGFTGSYIFSQTIFSGRAGVTSRLNGLVVAGTELALFALPFSLVQVGRVFFCP